jgi:hypothetical protein
MLRESDDREQQSCPEVGHSVDAVVPARCLACGRNRARVYTLGDDLGNSVHLDFWDDPPLVTESLWGIPFGLVQFGIIVAVYRYDGVILTEIGLSRGLLRPAVIAATGVLIAVHAAVIGISSR